MAIQRSYLGGGKGVEIPNSDRIARSQERMDDLLMKANEYRLKSFKENQDRFLKMGDIDLETYISSANATTQGKLVDDYNSRAESILKQRGSFENFQTQDWVELQKGRKMLESAQAKMNADYERFKLDDQVIKRDGGRTYDLDKWALMKKDYLERGTYSEDPLPYAAGNIDLYLNAHKIKGKGAYTEIRPSKENPEKEIPFEYSAGKADVAPVIANAAITNPNYQEQAKREFASLPEAEQAKFYDVNNPLVQEYGKLGITNPILMNYVEKHYQSGIDVIPGAPQYKERSKGGGGIQFEFGYGTGTSVKYTPPKPVTGKTLGTMSLGTYFPFPQFESYNVPMGEITVLNQNGDQVRITDKTLNVQPLGYSKDKDMMIFRVKQNYRGYNKGTGDEIAVPLASLPPEFNNISVSMDGKDIPISSLKGISSTATETPADKLKALKEKR